MLTLAHCWEHTGWITSGWMVLHLTGAPGFMFWIHIFYKAFWGSSWQTISLKVPLERNKVIVKRSVSSNVDALPCPGWAIAHKRSQTKKLQQNWQNTSLVWTCDICWPDSLVFSNWDYEKDHFSLWSSKEYLLETVIIHLNHLDSPAPTCNLIMLVFHWTALSLN